MRDRRAKFFTNGFIFDEKIAQILGTNPNSSISLSIDSGTSKTWHKVKGVDNFDTVTENLLKYYAASAQPGQIILKYIVLPKVNDNMEDYLSVIKIMEVLQVKNLEISRDMFTKFMFDARQRDDLIRATASLIAVIIKNKMTYSMPPELFLRKEQERIVALTDELLRSVDV
jgi:MoaA/NifB/PqqE/SkfB family radical SAM enzyme